MLSVCQTYNRTATFPFPFILPFLLHFWFTDLSLRQSGVLEFPLHSEELQTSGGQASQGQGRICPYIRSGAAGLGQFGLIGYRLSESAIGVLQQYCPKLRKLAGHWVDQAAFALTEGAAWLQGGIAGGIVLN